MSIDREAFFRDLIKLTRESANRHGLFADMNDDLVVHKSVIEYIDAMMRVVYGVATMFSDDVIGVSAMKSGDDDYQVTVHTLHGPATTH